MTGTPLPRHASASFAAFSTTFCSFACCGDPDSANAPPSMITSFCMSWTISAVRFGSSLKSAIVSSYCMNGSRRPATLVSKR